MEKGKISPLERDHDLVTKLVSYKVEKLLKNNPTTHELKNL